MAASGGQPTGADERLGRCGLLCSGDFPIVLFSDSPKCAYYSGIIPRNCPFKPSFLELNIPHIVPKCATSCTHPTECLEQNQRIIWDHLNPHFWGRRKRGAYYSGIFYSADPPYYSKSNSSRIRQALKSIRVLCARGANDFGRHETSVAGDGRF